MSHQMIFSTQVRVDLHRFQKVMNRFFKNRNEVFYGDLVYKFEGIVRKPSFIVQFKKIINHDEK